jgi:hypothetical protein
MQIAFHIFGTQPDLEPLGFLGPLSQGRLVWLDHAVVPAVVFDHGLALSVEVKNDNG